MILQGEDEERGPRTGNALSVEAHEAWAGALNVEHGTSKAGKA